MDFLLDNKKNDVISEDEKIELLEALLEDDDDDEELDAFLVM